MEYEEYDRNPGVQLKSPEYDDDLGSIIPVQKNCAFGVARRDRFRSDLDILAAISLFSLLLSALVLNTCVLAFSCLLPLCTLNTV